MQQQLFNIGDRVLYMNEEYEVYAFYGGKFDPEVSYPYWIKRHKNHTLASNNELQPFGQFNIGDIVIITDELSFNYKRMAEVLNTSDEFVRVRTLETVFYEGLMHQSRLKLINRPKFKVGDKIKVIFCGRPADMEIKDMRSNENSEFLYSVFVGKDFYHGISYSDVVNEKHLLAIQIKPFKKGEEVWVRATIDDTEPDSDGDIELLMKCDGSDCLKFVAMSEVFRKQEIPGLGEKNV